MEMENIIKKPLNITVSSASSSRKKKISRDKIFPNEILYRIFSYCDIDTLFHSIPYVSHQWNSLLTKMSFAGQINLKIYDDEQFKKLYSKSKSSFSSHSNPYAIPNTSNDYTGYSSYGSYGGLSNYDNYSSYSNYNSYGNYEGYGSFNGYSNYNDYSSYYGYGNSSSSYSFSSTRKNKESEEINDLLEPNYHIELLDTKQTNNEVSMPVVFKIDLALPLSFIKAKQEEEIDDSFDLFGYHGEYFSNDINDLSLASSSSNSNKNEIKNTSISFDLEPVQGYLTEKQNEIKQFKPFYYIHGIEISIDTDKVITVHSNHTENNNDNQATTSEDVSTTTNPVVPSSTIEMNSSISVGTSSIIRSESLPVVALLDNISNTVDNGTSSSLLSSVTPDGASSTEIPAAPPSNPIQPENSPPNSTMILTELLLEKYRFTPEILKIQNVQWSDKFIYMIPKNVKIIEINYLGNPDPELLKEGTDYLYSFIKNITISASSILRPRTRRGNRFYHPSVNRTSITVN